MPQLFVSLCDLLELCEFLSSKEALGTKLNLDELNEHRLVSRDLIYRV